MKKTVYIWLLHKRGQGGFRLRPNVWSTFFKELNILAKCIRGGGQVLAKTFGALLKDFVVLDFLKIFSFIWAKCPRGREEGGGRREEREGRREEGGGRRGFSFLFLHTILLAISVVYHLDSR